MDNSTFVTEFVLLGFTNLHELKMAFYTILLLMYLISVTGHVLVIIVIIIEPKLHSPMYFFLVNFSVAEICSTTTEVPKMLINGFLGKTAICFACCMAQGFIVFTMGSVEFMILTLMSFDRYVAICKPLLYNNIMTNGFCFRLATLAWVGGFAIIFAQAVVVWTYHYCEDNVIDHFFCDVGPVLKLACADTTLMELIGFIYGAIFMWGSFGLSFVSCICITDTIIHIPSATGRSKAFVTCASHLTVVTIFYLAYMFMYLRPSTQGDTKVNKVVSLVCTSFIPMLNPFIYTIRNKDFKAAVRTAVKGKPVF